MIESNDSINIRAIQHFMFCPRRFALLEINNDWAENVYVIKSNLMHEAVHDGLHTITSKDIIAKSSIAVYNDDYGIYGVLDCIEFIRSSGGVEIPGLEGRFKIRIIEYKPKPPRNGTYHESDALQMFAQKLCADYLWLCDSEAYIYYSEKRRRVKIPFDDNEIYAKFDNLIKCYLREMRYLLANNKIPPKQKKQNCSGCSLKEFCFPKSTFYNVQQKISNIDNL